MSSESISGRHDSQALIIGMAGAIGILFAFALCVCFAGCSGYRRYHGEQVKRRKFVNSNLPTHKYDKNIFEASGGRLRRAPNSMGADSQQEIHEIPETAPDPEDDDVCSICLVQFKKGEKISWSANEKAHCSHTYHTWCIKEWLCKGHKECPMCREIFLCEESSNEDEDGSRGEHDIETGTTPDNDLPLNATIETNEEEELDA